MFSGITRIERGIWGSGNYRLGCRYIGFVDVFCFLFIWVILLVFFEGEDGFF